MVLVRTEGLELLHATFDSFTIVEQRGLVLDFIIARPGLHLVAHTLELFDLLLKLHLELLFLVCIIRGGQLEGGTEEERTWVGKYIHIMNLWMESCI